MTRHAATSTTTSSRQARETMPSSVAPEKRVGRGLEHIASFPMSHAPPTEPSAEISQCILRVSRSRLLQPLWLDRR